MLTRIASARLRPRALVGRGSSTPPPAGPEVSPSGPIPPRPIGPEASDQARGDGSEASTTAGSWWGALRALGLQPRHLRCSESTLPGFECGLLVHLLRELSRIESARSSDRTGTSSRVADAGIARRIDAQSPKIATESVGAPSRVSTAEAADCGGIEPDCDGPPGSLDLAPRKPMEVRTMARVRIILSLSMRAMAGGATARDADDPAAVHTRLVVIQAEKGSEARPIVALANPKAAADPAGPRDTIGGILARELFRQSLLIAARDELGLATRDEPLGDAPAVAADGSVGDPAGTRTTTHSWMDASRPTQSPNPHVPSTNRMPQVFKNRFVSADRWGEHSPQVRSAVMARFFGIFSKYDAARIRPGPNRGSAVTEASQASRGGSTKCRGGSGRSLSASRGRRAAGWRSRAPRRCCPAITRAAIAASPRPRNQSPAAQARRAVPGRPSRSTPPMARRTSPALVAGVAGSPWTLPAGWGSGGRSPTIRAPGDRRPGRGSVPF